MSFSLQECLETRKTLFVPQSQGAVRSLIEMFEGFEEKRVGYYCYMDILKIMLCGIS